jgi:hypothetical protein
MERPQVVNRALDYLSKLIYMLLSFMSFRALKGLLLYHNIEWHGISYLSFMAFLPHCTSAYPAVLSRGIGYTHNAGWLILIFFLVEAMDCHYFIQYLVHYFLICLFPSSSIQRFCLVFFLGSCFCRIVLFLLQLLNK